MKALENKEKKGRARVEGQRETENRDTNLKPIEELIF